MRYSRSSTERQKERIGSLTKGISIPCLKDKALLHSKQLDVGGLVNFTTSSAALKHEAEQTCLRFCILPDSKAM